MLVAQATWCKPLGAVPRRCKYASTANVSPRPGLLRYSSVVVGRRATVGFGLGSLRRSRGRRSGTIAGAGIGACGGCDNLFGSSRLVASRYSWFRPFLWAASFCPRVVVDSRRLRWFPRCEGKARALVLTLATFLFFGPDERCATKVVTAVCHRHPIDELVFVMRSCCQPLPPMRSAGRPLSACLQWIPLLRQVPREFAAGCATSLDTRRRTAPRRPLFCRRRRIEHLWYGCGKQRDLCLL